MAKKFKDLAAPLYEDPKSRAQIEQHKREMEVEIFACKLVDLRKELGISQTDLAERLGISQPASPSWSDPPTPSSPLCANSPKLSEAPSTSKSASAIAPSSSAQTPPMVSSNDWAEHLMPPGFLTRETSTVDFLR